MACQWPLFAILLLLMISLASAETQSLFQLLMLFCTGCSKRVEGALLTHVTRKMGFAFSVWCQTSLGGTGYRAPNNERGHPTHFSQQSVHASGQMQENDCKYLISKVLCPTEIVSLPLYFSPWGRYNYCPSPQTMTQTCGGPALCGQAQVERVEIIY